MRLDMLVNTALAAAEASTPPPCPAAPSCAVRVAWAASAACAALTAAERPLWEPEVARPTASSTAFRSASPSRVNGW